MSEWWVGGWAAQGSLPLTGPATAVNVTAATATDTDCYIVHVAISAT